MTDEDVVSAQVTLVPACAADLPAIMDGFAREGFTTAAPFAGNFSITAPRMVFERVFQTPMRSDLTELPLHALPYGLREKVAAVVFTTADFGPGSY